MLRYAGNFSLVQVNVMERRTRILVHRLTDTEKMAVCSPYEMPA